MPIVLYYILWSKHKTLPAAVLKTKSIRKSFFNILRDIQEKISTFNYKMCRIVHRLPFLLDSLGNLWSPVTLMCHYVFLTLYYCLIYPYLTYCIYNDNDNKYDNNNNTLFTEHLSYRGCSWKCLTIKWKKKWKAIWNKCKCCPIKPINQSTEYQTKEAAKATNINKLYIDGDLKKKGRHRNSKIYKNKQRHKNAYINFYMKYVKEQNKTIKQRKRNS